MRLVEQGKKSLGFWQSKQNRATWEFENVSQDAVYAIELIYSLHRSNAGAEFLLTCGAGEQTLKLPATAGQTLKVGEIAVPDVGRTVLSLQTHDGAPRRFNLQAIILRKQ